MDNECLSVSVPVGETQIQYQKYLAAVQQGYLSESALDASLIRLFAARLKLGLLDPPELDPWSHIDEKELGSPEHRALAREIANESMVLLKNDGRLPLKPGIRNIAVVGPLADQTDVLLGNYAGRPTHTVSMMEGLKAAFPGAHITYVPGTQFLLSDGQPVPDNLLTTADGQPGLKANYYEWTGTSFRPDSIGAALASRNEPNIHLTRANLPTEVAAKKSVCVQWTGLLHPPEFGLYMIGIRASGTAVLSVAGNQIASTSGSGGYHVGFGAIQLDKGEPAALSVRLGFGGGSEPAVQLLWAKVTDEPSAEAIAAARKADVVIAAVGITSHLEGEQSGIDLPGFLGGDRTSIDLPGPEEVLVEGMVATGKPVVVVLMNGSALAVNWINDHANAVLESWYSGEEGGNAIADTLSGKNNPAGRLPVTFYKSVVQLPNFEDYSMQNRTYRYFTGKPLYPFGYGLSYTTFGYSNLKLPEGAIHAGDPLVATITLTNNGKVAGDEVAQLYLTFPNVAGSPLRALRAFQRVHLEPGASQDVEFHLSPRDLSMVTEAGDIIVAQGKYTIAIGGGQPGTDAPTKSGSFEVKGKIQLPE